MKKFLFLIVFTCLLFIGNVFSQTLYSDDFESYTVNQGIAQQNPTWWSTWHNSPGTAEDPKVSDAFAYNSSLKSVKVSGTNDAVIKFPNYTTGRYRIEFYFMVPTGKQAYYNIMQHFDPTGQGLLWGMQAFFHNGTMQIDGGRENAANFTYTPGEWIKIQHFIDLDGDWIDMYINDQLIHAYKWSLGTSGSNNTNVLSAIDFYAWDENGTPEFYIDNFLIEHAQPVPQPTNFAYTIENNNNIKLTWTAPSGNTPEKYSIARDGEIIGHTTELTYTDLNLYPNTYNYTLLAYYGTANGYSSPTAPISVTIAGGNERKFVLLELCTSTLCSHCPRATKGLDLIAAEPGVKVGIIEYHCLGMGNDPYFIPANEVIENKYKALYHTPSSPWGYPANMYNGEKALLGALEDQNAMKEAGLYYYNKFKNVPAVYTIDIAATATSANTYSFNITSTETFRYYNNEMRLFAVLTETDIPYSWQGNTTVNYVARAVYPDGNGKVLNFANAANSDITNIEVEIPNTYNLNKCELIVFIQNMTTGQIQQVDKIKLSSISNNSNITATNISVYPNPANNYINITSDNLISNVKIYNITGQLVANFDKQINNIDISNYDAGIYFVEIQTNNNITKHKFIKYNN